MEINNNIVDYQPLSGIDFGNTGIQTFYVDTRDFHCKMITSSNHEHVSKIDIDKILKYSDRFFHTTDEVQQLINRYKSESGGDVKWRYFSLDGNGEKQTSGWQMKYITILRTQHGLLICGRDHVVFNKNVLSSGVNQKYLHAH